MKQTVRLYAELLGFAALIIALDQWTKWLVRTRLPIGEAWSPWDWLMPIARIYHIQNTGAAFGMFQNGNLVFSILAMVVSVVILYYYPRVQHEEWFLRLALVLQFAGAVGNLIDRLYQGYVTDFISVGTFFIFNVADSSISIGVAVLILGMLIKERQEQQLAKKTAGLEAEAPPSDSHPVEEAGGEKDA